MTSEEQRSQLHACKRVVIKVGSRALMAGADRFESIAAQATELTRAGKEVLIVSSGAVAAGRERLGFTQRPTELAELQAAAAAGQSLLMRTYEDAFEARGVHIAQVLLSHAGLRDEERSQNLRRTFDTLIGLGAVPIVNENDAVAVEELTFGDNDRLAAMVSVLVGAELLVMLSDVEGVLDDNAKRISIVRDSEDVAAFVKPATDDVGLGGMGSKIEAAHQASQRGIHTVIGPAADDTFFKKLLAGKDVGTLFLATDRAQTNSQHWIP